MLLELIAGLTMATVDIGWGLFGLSALVCMMIPVIWFIIGILLCIWVYRDAESRGMSGVLWLIVVLITGIVGLIIYLVVRKDKKTAQSVPPPPS